MIKTLKSIILTGFLIVSSISIITPTLSTNAADTGANVFASGINANRDDTADEAVYNWTGALDTTDVGALASNVIGAKITIYTINDSNWINAK